MTLQRTSIQAGKTSYPHYYLCHYLPVSTGRDTLSHSLLRFKLGSQPDLSGWIDCALDTLADAPILPHTSIVRALHHQETIVRAAGPGANPSSLDNLGRALAARFQSNYHPGLLRKSRPTREIKGFTREQRAAELQDLYYIAENQQTGANPILIIDDILTTATTIRAIIAALRPRYPHSTLSIFTLARAAYTPGSNRSLPLHGKNYHLQQGMDWVVAEDPPSWQTASPFASSPWSRRQLTAWIDADDFPI